MPEPAAGPRPAAAATREPAVAPVKPTPSAAGRARPSRPAGPAVRDWLPRWSGPDRPLARAAGTVILAVLLILQAVDFAKTDAVQYPEISTGYWGTVLVLALVGLGVAAFELPPRWPTTVVHLLNAVYFVVLPLVLFHLRSVYYDPGSTNNSSALLQGILLAGTIAYVIAALGCGVAVRRRTRDAVTVMGLVTTVLIAVGAALITVSAYRDPRYLSPAGCVILLAAALSSLVMAATLVRMRFRPPASAGR